MSDLDDVFMFNRWFKYEKFKKNVKSSKSAKIKLLSLIEILSFQRFCTSYHGFSSQSWVNFRVEYCKWVTQHHFKPCWRSTAHSQTLLHDLKVRSQKSLKWSKSDNYITLWKSNGVKSDIIRSPVLDLVIIGGNVMRFVHKIEIRDDPVWIIPKSYQFNLISLITFVNHVRFGWCLYAQYMIRVWGIQKS